MMSGLLYARFFLCFFGLYPDLEERNNIFMIINTFVVVLLLLITHFKRLCGLPNARHFDIISHMFSMEEERWKERARHQRGQEAGERREGT